FVAADLLSQAEHGPDSQVLLITPSTLLLEQVQAQVEKLLALLPRREIAAQSLRSSRLFLVADLEEAMALCNAYAPEHLILAVAEPERWAEQVVNAGSVFLGHFSPESAGDYASGPNHTLPTNGRARAYSGVSLDSFVKKITFQAISARGLQGLAPAVSAMAHAEGLEAHRQAVEIRLLAAEEASR
ncbi:MAG: histidinol dehydrogenase, partial [Calditrichaeota bacterium]